MGPAVLGVAALIPADEALGAVTIALPHHAPAEPADRTKGQTLPAPAFAQAHHAPSPHGRHRRHRHRHLTHALPAPAWGLADKGRTRLAQAAPSRAKPATPTTIAASPDDATTRVNQPVKGNPAPKFSADDELILQLETAHGEMADSIVAHDARTGTYLPLGAITRFLDLAIAVSDDGHYASGWFLNENRKLVLNLREGTLVVNGKTIPLARDDAVAYDGDIFLKAERFSDLLPLKLKVDMRAQNVVITTLEQFPFQERIAREQARDKLGGKRGSNQRHWPRQVTPYRAFTLPLVDVETRALSDTNLGTRGETDIRMAGDLAFMTARAFATSSTRYGLTAARLQLGRRDPDAKLLGPMKASEFQIGDVSTASLPMGVRGVSGRGAFVTNLPLEHASIFDTINLEGDLPDGYEVELYRNGQLIGSSKTPVNGQYQFKEVSLDFGLNVFRMVFYGPQGQRRETVRRISVGDGRLGKGEFVYSVGVAQKDVNLFAARLPTFVPSQDYGSLRTTAMMRYGLSTALTVNAGGAMYQSGGQKRWLAYAGLRTGIASMALKLDAAAENGGGMSLQAGLGGRLAGFSYILNHAEYANGFVDEVRAYGGDSLRRVTQLDVNRTIRLSALKGMPTAFSLLRVETATGAVQTSASLRETLSLGRFMISNSSDLSMSSTPGAGTLRQWTGSFDLATLSGRRSNVRVAVDYAVMPKPRLTTLGLDLDHNFNDHFAAKMGISRAFTSGETRLSMAVLHRFKHFNLSTDATYGLPSKTYAISLHLNASFGRNPMNGRMFMEQSGLSSSGAVAVRAFRDDNGNGRFDVGEAVLPKVDFNTGTRTATTDKNGIAFIPALGDGNRASVQIATETLPDIAMAPASEGIELVPRAGRVHIANFPVVALSDVEGTAYFGRSGTDRAVSGLNVWLVDAQNKVAAHTRTEADGFFLFEQVHPGHYRLMIDPNQAKGLNIHTVEDIPIDIAAKSAVLRKILRVTND